MKFYKNIIINKLNNYKWNNDNIELVKNYLLNGDLPRIRKKRFQEKYQDFVMENDKIIYQPLNLEVIPDDKIEETLKNYYDDFKAIGNGKEALYKKISSLYINITRNDVKQFLEKEPIYQINTETKHIVNKPILASSCGERIACDLIDVSNLSKYNNKNKYILTCIDYFSRKVWAYPLTNKRSDNIKDGLQHIFNQIGFFPRLLQSDNGREFKNYDNINWLKENNCKPVFSLSYSPESNGLIENFNKQVRRMMRDIFIRTNNLNWIDYLQIICDNKNESYNSTTKSKPNTLWNEDSYYFNIDRNKEEEVIEPNDLSNEAVRIRTRDNIKAKAKKQLEQNEINELEVGDNVRVKMSSIYSEIRKEIKQGNKKLLNVTYTPDIYRIFKVIKEDHPGYERRRYTLKKLDGTPLYTEKKSNEMKQSHRYRRLFASDLLKVDENTNNINFDNDRALKLNKIEIEKPIVDKPIKEKRIVHKVIDEQPQEIRRSTRERKQKIDNDYVY